MHKQMEQMASDAQLMGKRGEAWFHEQMRQMEPVVDLQAQIILFGIDEPNARRRWAFSRRSIRYLFVV